MVVEGGKIPCCCCGRGVFRGCGVWWCLDFDHYRLLGNDVGKRESMVLKDRGGDLRGLGIQGFMLVMLCGYKQMGA